MILAPERKQSPLCMKNMRFEQTFHHHHIMRRVSSNVPTKRESQFIKLIVIGRVRPKIGTENIVSLIKPEFELWSQLLMCKQFLPCYKILSAQSTTALQTFSQKYLNQTVLKTNTNNHPNCTKQQNLSNTQEKLFFGYIGFLVNDSLIAKCHFKCNDAIIRVLLNATRFFFAHSPTSHFVYIRTIRCLACFLTRRVRYTFLLIPVFTLNLNTCVAARKDVFDIFEQSET